MYDAIGGSAKPSLRDYQQTFVDEFRRRVAAGRKRQLGVSPTGSGKTIIATAIVGEAVARGERVLFLVHRRELIKQSSVKLHAGAIDHGIVAASFPSRPGEPVQVAMVPTLHARAMRTRRMELPPADLLVVDEAHHATADSWERLICSYPEAALLGLTATPCRKSGGGLGDVFEDLLECPQVDELIKAGWLVGTKVYGPPEGPNLKGLHTRGGDYVERELAERVNTAKLVGDVVEHWLKHAHGLRTIVFATNVAHSVHLRDQFRASGVVAEHVDGSTPADERDGILKRLADGVVDVVTNCNVLSEGFDLPDIGAIALARPTKSFGYYRQMVGRGLRPAPGKDCLIVVDHAGATSLHGFVEEPVEWSLEVTSRAESQAKATSRAQHERILRACPECSAWGWQGRPCQACGWQPRPKPKPIDYIDADLARIERDGRRTPDQIDQRDFYRQLVGIGQGRGYKPGFATSKFKEKFGDWPPRSWRNDEPLDPTPQVEAWVRSRFIAWRKAQAKSGAPWHRHS